MAEDQVNGLNNDENVITLDKVDATIGFNRFLFLKNIQSNFVKPQELKLKRDIVNEEFKQISHFLKQLVDTNPTTPLNLIKKALQSKLLFFDDAAIYCLVICLFEASNEDLKKEIRKQFNEIITTSDQLLLFMHFYATMKDGKLNLGRGMRNVLTRWYDSKNDEDLVEILHASKKIKKIGHKSLVHMAHIKLADEKSKILQATYKTVDITPESSPLEKKIAKYRQLKSSKTIEEVIDILKAKEFNYKLAHVPSFALKSTEVVDLILPLMTFRELMDNLILFCSHKMLKVQEPISKKICNALQVSNKIISDAHFHPLHVFLLSSELEKRLTIIQDPSHRNENGNASHEGDETPKIEKKLSNPYVIKKLQHIFTQTMNDQPKTGCRFFVTVNFRNFRKRKVYGLHNVTCPDLQAIIALTLLKNEKEVTMMSFSENANKLKNVEWSSETSYEKAMEIYARESKETPKTKEVLALPIKKAIEDKKKVDVFITFVSSLGRTMGNSGKPDKLIAELQNYRRVMNSKMTKYIVINMTRKSPDLHYNENNINEKGILEIVGFSEASTKVIEAFAKNCFA